MESKLEPITNALVVGQPPTENSGSSNGRARGLANLKPYKKGQSGNPGGRPKGIVSKALTKELKRKAAQGETVLVGYPRCALISFFIAPNMAT